MKNNGCDTIFKSTQGSIMHPNSRILLFVIVAVWIQSSNLVWAFDKGDVVFVLRDTEAHFNDTVDHTEKAGNKITVYQHDKDSGKVYFLSTDSEGKQIALNIISAFLGTEAEYEEQKAKQLVLILTKRIDECKQVENNLNNKDKTPESLSVEEVKLRGRAALIVVDMYITTLKQLAQISSDSSQRILSTLDPDASLINTVANKECNELSNLFLELEQKNGLLNANKFYPGIIGDKQKGLLQNEICALLLTCVSMHQVVLEGTQDLSLVSKLSTQEKEVHIVSVSLAYGKKYLGILTELREKLSNHLDN